MMHDKDKLLLKIANTIVANIGNTTDIGLMNGKTGVCLFLYEYSRYSGIEYYEDVANGLLDDVFKGLNPRLSQNMVDGTAGIGWGILYMLEEHFLECDEKQLMKDFDNVLFKEIGKKLSEECRFSFPFSSVGLYLAKRIDCHENCAFEEMRGVLDDFQENLGEMLDGKMALPNSYLLSIAFVLKLLREKNDSREMGELECKANTILSLQKTENTLNTIDREMCKLLMEKNGLPEENMVLSLVEKKSVEMLWMLLVYGIFHHFNFEKAKSSMSEVCKMAYFDTPRSVLALTVCGILLIKDGI